ncbi:helix-turn-helix domain-containing protein [Streptomyces sp. A5-4]|uniref:helix-turn-helix domain-containing protein n=1 Tax=Streptomyces sp. A5-4 TaxID=3384771 RepID=UPI003DA7D565
MFAELAGPWEAARQSTLRAARGGSRRRAEGAGRKPKLVFFDRLLVTLVHLRHQLPHAVLAELFDVDRSTVSEAIRQVRPLLAARGFAVPDRAGLRLKTLEDGVVNLGRMSCPRRENSRVSDPLNGLRREI